MGQLIRFHPRYSELREPRVQWEYVREGKYWTQKGYIGYAEYVGYIRDWRTDSHEAWIFRFGGNEDVPLGYYTTWEDAAQAVHDQIETWTQEQERFHTSHTPTLLQRVKARFLTPLKRTLGLGRNP